MVRYITWRLLATVPLIFAVAVIAFGLVALLEVRGSVAEYILQESATEHAVADLEQEMGLNEPLINRFGDWLWSAVHGDLGESLANHGVPVTTLLAERIWPTLSILLPGLLVASLVGIAFGLLSGVRPGGAIDRVLSLLSAIMMSVPAFVVGLLLVSYFAVQLGWFDPTGYKPPGRFGWWEWLRSITLPSVALALPIVAVIQRQLRSSMSAVLQSPYVLAARARGVPTGMILRRHAMRNAMVPTVTVIGFWAAAAMGLTTAVELVFNVQGLGMLMVDSINRRDVTVVQGCLVVGALFVAAVNLIVDISYGWLNPKVRLT